MTDDIRSGKLVRKLMIAFVLFALVAITLSAAFIYTSVRSTYLGTQANRLAQLADYAGASASSNGYDAGNDLSVWLEMDDIIDRDISYEEFVASQQQAIDDYNALVIQYNEAEAAGDTATTAALLPQMEEAGALTERMGIASYYYALLNMMSRLKAAYEISDFVMIAPEDDRETVVCVAAGIAGEESSGEGDVPFLGDTLERSEADYPALWRAYDEQKAANELELSPDGSRYLMYVPVSSVLADTWLVVVSIPSAALDSAVMAQMVPTLSVTVAVYIVCLAALLVLFRSQLVRPLIALSGLVSGYAHTHEASCADEIRSHAWPRDEVGILADRTAAMIDETDAHTQRLAALTAERERVRSELAVATRIQASALPEVTPAFTGEGGFALSASMEPAKEVGGDFYDFFMVDSSHVAVVVADVSDKGVPAALFMMRAKAIIKQLLMEGLAPAEAMARANDDLCHDNEQGMFVTAWIGVLDTQDGTLSYACGGHNPPLVRAHDGTVTWLRDRSGLMLGSFEGVGYRAFSRTLELGDMLVLYTDGVTEAMDESGTCMGEPALEQIVAQAADSPDDLMASVLAGVHAYAGSAPQADDITMLCLQRTSAPQDAANDTDEDGSDR